MVLSSSAGIMAGDNQLITIDIGGNSNVEIVSQSYEKLHKMVVGNAIRETEINVESGSTLIYNPMPTIPFAQSSFKTTTQIHLEDNTAKLVFTEILTAGRVHSNEIFEYNYYESRLDIFVGPDVVYIDNTYFDPVMFDMTSYGMYEGYTHLLNLIIVNIDVDIEELRTLLNTMEEIMFGATLTYYEDICIKVLAYNAQVLENIVEEILNKLFAYK